MSRIREHHLSPSLPPHLFNEAAHGLFTLLLLYCFLFTLGSAIHLCLPACGAARPVGVVALPVPGVERYTVSFHSQCSTCHSHHVPQLKFYECFHSSCLRTCVLASLIPQSKFHSPKFQAPRKIDDFIVPLTQLLLTLFGLFLQSMLQCLCNVPLF